jgi:hypothetical protein
MALIDRLLHRFRLCGCWGMEPVSWHVDGKCEPLGTLRGIRERRAVEAHHRDRHLVRAIARRGHVTSTEAM